MIGILRSLGDLRRERWEFTFYTQGAKLILRCVHYSIECRASKRHKWKAEKFYESYDRRSGNVRREDVPMPEEVIRLAMVKLHDAIEVTV
jgi:hypothetical protein